jgi:AhpD family alkylhydroperoxidase
MSLPLVDYEEASPRVRAVFDAIMAARGTDWVNNFWKALANHPDRLEATWDRLRTVMAPGALDPLTKELVYLAVSMSQGCDYCIASHTAAARGKGMDDAMLGELIAVVGLAVELNRTVQAYRVPVDDRFKGPAEA